jgi:proteasome lid subunit RPN8/RPN11
MPAAAKRLWTIEDQPWRRMLDHTVADYPREACGMLLCSGDTPRHVTEIHPTKNVTLEDPTRRYLVDPLEFIAVDKRLEQDEIDICGFYHSHPDHPCAPSKHDRKLAWEGYLYVIVSITDSKFNDAGAWIYNPESKQFKKVIFQYSKV